MRENIQNFQGAEREDSSLNSGARSSGFTLLEVMIALTILAAISFSLFAVTSQTLNSKSSTEDRDEMQHSITLALDKMSDDLNMAFIVNSKELLGPDFDGDYAFQGGEDRVDFVSFSHQRYIENAKESDAAEISYFLAPMPDEPGMRMLVRRESTAIDKNLQEGGETVPLLEGVENIKFEYYDDKSKEFKRAWDTRSVDYGSKLPVAVKITLELKLPDAEERSTFTTWVPVQLFKGPVVF